MLENLHATAPPFNRAYVLQVPIVSIDYSLAPEFPYPQAHHECFHVYAWVLRNAHKLGKSFFCLVDVINFDASSATACIFFRICLSVN